MIDLFCFCGVCGGFGGIGMSAEQGIACSIISPGDKRNGENNENNNDPNPGAAAAPGLNF